jgi:hypothetical protein
LEGPSNPKELAISPQLNSNELVTWIHRGPSDKLVICFSGIGKKADSCPGYEFARTASGDGQHNVLFIADPNRTWLNGPGLLGRIRDEIDGFKARCEASRVIAMGHSMGGFSALVAPSITRVHEVLAFAPQISVHPEIVPDESRWPIFRERIKLFEIVTAEDYLQDDTNYTVIHGRHRLEAPQRERFPRQKNLRHYVMPLTHHNVPQRLKSKKCLSKVIDCAIEGRPRKLRLLLKDKARAILLAQHS